VDLDERTRLHRFLVRANVQDMTTTASQAIEPQNKVGINSKGCHEGDCACPVEI
jgi:hypothetical protein